MSGKIWTPGITYEEAVAKAQNLRSTSSYLQKIPVDIEEFLQFDLGIDIVPMPGLKDRVQAEAMISLDFTTIYVDNASYLNDKQWNRLKFSLAHELGHCVLHKDFLEQQNISSPEQWVNFMMDIQLKYGYIENHANWFAGEILVPYAELEKAIQSTPRPTINSLSRKFEVSTTMIEKRLQSKDIARIIQEIE